MKNCKICGKNITSGSKLGFCKHCATTGSNNPNFKGDNRIKYFCADCGVEVSRKETKRCLRCRGIQERGVNHPNYKHGKTHNNKCLDCGKIITYRGIRCKSCESRGIRSNFYTHGNGYCPYTKDFTIKLRDFIRNRDDNKCVVCGMTKEEHFQKYNKNLDVHHIDHNKENCKEDNLETRCRKCNIADNFINREG